MSFSPQKAWCAKRWVIAAWCVASLLLTFLSSSISSAATTLTWTGAAGDGLIATPGNWSPAVAPSGGDLLVFAGTNSLLPQLSSGFTVGSLTFNSGAGAFTLGGAGTYTIGAGGVTNSSTNTETINNAITLGAAQTWNASAGNLTFGGNIANGGFLLTVGGAANTSASAIISGTGGLTKTGGGTLTLSGANTYSGATTISQGVVNIRNATALGTTAGATTVSSGAALQLQGGISVGAEALTLNGGGVSSDGALRNISGNNSMSGAITLGSGATIGSDTGTLTLSGALNNGGFLLTETGAGNVTLSGVMSGAGGLTMNGSGTLTLSGSGNNTYTGTTTVTSGLLVLNKNASIDALAGALVIGNNTGVAGSATVRELLTNQLNSATSVTVNPSGVLDLNNVADKLTNLTLQTGDIAGASITTGTAKLTLNSDLTVGVQGTGAVGATISGNIADGGAVRTFTVNDGTADADLTISAVLQGMKGYTKAGAGRLVLSGANTSAGPLTINAGPLQLQNVNAISSFTTTTVNSGGALEFTGGLTFAADPVTLNGSGVGGTGAILNVSGNNTFGGAFTLGSDSTIGSAANALTLSGAINTGGFLLTFDGAGDTISSGLVSGAGGLTKIGSGTLTLTGAASNTYTGLTSVNDGTVLLNMTAGKNASNGNFLVGDGTGAANSAVMQWLGANQIPNKVLSLNPDGLADLNGFSDAINAVNMTGGNITTGAGTLTLGGTLTGNAATTTATITGNLALGGNRIFAIDDGAAAVDMNISAIISGANTVSKTGTGTLVFSGANTYTGATTVSAGVLNIQNATGLGTTAAGTTVSSGATLQLQGGITVGAAETLSLAGAGASGQSGALVNVSGTNNYGGLLTLTGATTFGSDTGTLNLTNTGTITGATFGLTLAGAGNGSISSIIGTTSGSVTKTGTGTWSLLGVSTYTGGTAINGGTLAINSSASLGATSGGLTINAGTLEVTSTFSETRSITLGNSASTFQIDSGQTYTNTTAISGTGSLNKSGAGTMALGASETYSGGTNVSAGTLQLNANNRIPDASAVTVSGGTLDLQTFTDTVGAVTLSGGSITGSGAGTLTSSSTYTLQSGSASAVLAGSGAVTKNTSGTVTLTGANTLTGSVTVSGGTLTLAASSGSALGSASGITVNNGGTLLLGANNQINNTAGLTLAGGTFAKGNFSEGASNAVGLGALTLTASGSHLDFGTGTVGSLSFASFAANSLVLTIDNWTGTLNTVGNASTDRLIFDTDQTANLSYFNFSGYNGATEFSLGGGFYEVVPLAPIPEPTTYAAGVLAVAAVAWHRMRRRLRRSGSS